MATRKKAKKHSEVYYAVKVQYRAGGPWEFYRDSRSGQMPELCNTSKCSETFAAHYRSKGYADARSVKVELREL